MASISKKNIFKPKTYTYILVLLAAVIFLLYGQTISHEYAIDDDLVTQNHRIVQKGFNGIPEIFTSYYFIDKKMQFGYRPLVMVSFAVEHQFFGQNPHVSHFVNILLYILNCFLVFLVLKKIFFRHHYLFPLLVTLLFVVHPIHTEVVCSIKSRDELLSFLFAFIALWLSLKYADTHRWWLLVLVFMAYVSAVFSKQTAYTFLAVIPLAVYMYKPETFKRNIIPLASCLLLGIFVASLPRLMLPPVVREIFFFENPLVREGSLLNRLSIAFYSIPFYLKLFLWPHPLVFYYGYNMIPILPLYHPVVVFGIALSAAAGVYALYVLRTKPVLAFGILYFFITISMFLNIVEPVAGIVAERFAYFASLGFCVVVVWLFYVLMKVKPEDAGPKMKNRTRLLVLSLVVLLPFGMRTYVRAGDWKNHAVLYGKDIAYMENSALGHAIYAELLVNEIFNSLTAGKQPADAEQKLALAASHYEKSFLIYDEYFSSYNNLAFIYYQFYKDYTRAIPLLEKAVSLRPTYTEAHFNLGFCRQMTGDMAGAEKHYYDAIATDSAFVQAYDYLSAMYLLQNDTAKAVQTNEKLMLVAPANDLPYVNLGKIFLSQGDTVKSMSHFEKAAELSPQNLDLMYNLAVFFDFKGDTAKAAYYGAKVEALQKKQ